MDVDIRIDTRYYTREYSLTRIAPTYTHKIQRGVGQSAVVHVGRSADMDVDTHTYTRYCTRKYSLTYTTTHNYPLHTKGGQSADVYVGESADVDLDFKKVKVWMCIGWGFLM